MPLVQRCVASGAPLARLGSGTRRALHQGMSTTMIILIVLLAILVFGGGGFYLRR
jgi:hypothetical protein